MSQFVFFLGVYWIGVCLLLACGPWKRWTLCFVIAFPCGLAVSVIVGLTAGILGLPLSPWSLLAMGLVLIGVLGGLGLKNGVPRNFWRQFVFWSTAFAIYLGIVVMGQLTATSYDSFHYVMFGRDLALDGMMSNELISQLRSWGVFQVVVQSFAPLIGESYFWSVAPLLGGAFIGAFACLLWTEFGAVQSWKRVGLITLLIGFLLSNYMVIFHYFYIHTNFASAVYLFLFASLFWWGKKANEPGVLPVAFVCLVGFALQRTENPLFAVIFAGIFISYSDYSRKMLARYFILFVVVVGGWYELLAQNYSLDVLSNGGGLTPPRARAVWAGLLLFWGWLYVGDSPRVRKASRFLPEIVFSALLVLLAVVFVLKSDHMLESIWSWQYNLLSGGYWGLFWYWILAFVGLSFFLPKSADAAPFYLCAIVFVLFIHLMGAMRPPFRVSVWDSSSRMMMHIVPLLFFYFSLRISGLFAATDRCKIVE